MNQNHVFGSKREDLAELIGQKPGRIIEELKRLKCYRSRALDFESAATLLRKQGIGADRENL